MVPSGDIEPLAATGATSSLSPSKPNEQRQHLHERPLVARTQTRLDERFVEDGRPVDNITEATGILTGYRRDTANTRMVFENGSKPVSHRFNEAYAGRKYAQGMDAAKALQRRFSDPHTAMITLRAYPFNANHEGRAFVDHLRDLLSPNRHVLRRLQYHLTEKRGLEFGRLSVIQPHDTGYAHIQHGLWIDGSVDRDALQPAVDAHLQHCPVAREKNHRGRTITIRRATSENRVGEALVRELSKDLVGFEDCISSPDRKERLKYKRLGATLMAANVNQWRPDQSTFQQAIKSGQSEYEPHDRGEYEGIRFDTDGEVLAPSEMDTSGGGVTMVEVTDVDPDDDPLPAVS